jgi:hypothetical protein
MLIIKIRLSLFYNSSDMTDLADQSEAEIIKLNLNIKIIV